MRVRGSMETVSSIEVNVDTVYVRTNIIPIDSVEFKGWEYDEIQYTKDEYIELVAKENAILKDTADMLVLSSI